MSDASLGLSSLPAHPTTLAFVDADVADAAALVSQFKPGTEVHLLDSSQDAIAQITQVLAHRSHVSAVHLVSHGSDGALLLGGKTVSDLNKYDAELKQWSSSLTPDADILLYGCDVAGDTKGKAFVNQLAQLTGADVAASDDLTGSSALGGDWMLEYQTGRIDVPAFAALDYSGTLATFIVTSLSDVVNANDGVITLREAIDTANALDGTDTIIFGVNGTINLTEGELLISSNLNILGNGATNTLVSGNNASRVFNISSGNVTLSGLTVFNGGAVDQGGGIFNQGTLRVQASTIRNNWADDEGGGIFNQGTLTVINSTLERNSALSDGGGIFNDGTATITGGSFIENSATDDTDSEGGGIYNETGASLSVTSSTFTRNVAFNEGGGIFNDGTATITGGSFTENSVTDDDGGAINNQGTLTVIGSTFTRNSAADDGGAINQEDDASLTISVCTFRDNGAEDDGGAIRIFDGTVTVSNSLFQNNRAENGGAIRHDSSGTTSITGSTFLGNVASEDGGAISNTFSGILTLTANVIRQNRAANGGGVFTASGRTTNLRANNITANTATDVGPDLNGPFSSQGFNLIGKGGGFTGITNGVNGDVILVP